MANSFFNFKQFTVHQQRAAMKVTTDGCLFGAWCAEEIKNEKLIINNCLDIGTGTGLLTLIIAQKNNCHIDAVEIDENAYEEALENITVSPWRERIFLHHSDIKIFEKQDYNCIISNPPFYENDLQSGKSAKDTAHHSKNLQLNELLQIISKKLTPDGSFYLLLPYKRKDEVTLLLEKNLLFKSKIVSVKQTPKHSPFRLMIKGKKTASPVEKNEIIIYDEHRSYTEEFIFLLKNYYLYL